MHTRPTRRRQPHARPAARRASRGIVLIEVMVALLLFLFGVLGVVGLQSAMTRAQTDSKFRADAAYLAQELIGRMWSDLTNFATYNGSGCASAPRCLEWQNKTASALPKGTGAVAVDATTGNVTVTITWTMPDGESHQYVTATNLSKSAS